jgi:hypothetical protein
MEIGDFIKEMNKDVFSSFDHHLMVKLTPESFSEDVFQKRADDLISYLGGENSPAHVTFLLDEYGYIPGVYHCTFLKYFTAFLDICVTNAGAAGLGNWERLLKDSRSVFARKLNQSNQAYEEGYDIRHIGKRFFVQNRSNDISLSVHVSRKFQPPQRANFPVEQKWRRKHMKKNQFDLLKEIVDEVSRHDEDTKIQFLKENPEILFRTFRWRDRNNNSKENELRTKFARPFNVKTQLERLRLDEKDYLLVNFLLTQLLEKQKTEKRVSCMTRLDAFELWKFMLGKNAQPGDAFEPLTVDLIESILMIDIQTGAPRGEGV